MAKPNTFIVGAPKCGTTALSSYLSEHPQVFMSTPKEPNYFLRTLYPQKTEYHTLCEYLKLFDGATPEQKIVCEASVWYLFSAKAIDQIAEFDPGAKIIVMLRRPDEMLPAMHSQNLASMQEDIASFEQAWRQSVEKPRRADYPRLCKAPELLQYNKIAMYGEQLEYLFSVFPATQVKLVFFDDFSKDTAKEYKGVIEFLGIEPDRREGFQVVNPNNELRNRRLGSFLKRPPKSLVSLAAVVKRTFGLNRLGVHARLSRMNSKVTNRQSLSPDLAREIVLYHKEDVGLLSRITGRDLSGWL